MNKRLFTGIILIILVLSSCQILKATPAVEPAISTITPSVVITTSTRQPANTATITLPTETVDILATQTQRADDLLQAEMDAFPPSCKGAWQRIMSPHHETLAMSCGYKRGQTLEIINKTGQLWILNFYDYLPEGNEDGVMGGLIPEQWSTDGLYLYFSPYIAWDGGGTCFYGFGVSGLFRINIKTGDVSTILPLLSNMEGYLLSFSPNGRWLAYGANKLYILDIKTGQNYPINTKGVFGNLTWAPDNTNLIFATCQTNEDFSKIENSTIKIYSLRTNNIKTIVNETDHFLSIDGPVNDEEIRISNESFDTNTTNYSLYDWMTGEITQIESTPME